MADQSTYYNDQSGGQYYEQYGQQSVQSNQYYGQDQDGQYYNSGAPQGQGYPVQEDNNGAQQWTDPELPYNLDAQGAPVGSQYNVESHFNSLSVDPSAYQGLEQSSAYHNQAIVQPCDPAFMAPSSYVMAHSSSTRIQSCTPVVVSISPLASVQYPGLPNEFNQGTVPDVNFDMVGVVRCKACRGYINPYCTFVDGGARWKCSLCYRLNDVVSGYFCDLDPATGYRLDRMNRVELHQPTYDIVAPAEYMVRPPQPPAYIIAIDVSARAVQIGLVDHICTLVLSLLDSLPGKSRTQFAIITYDSCIHTYVMRPGSSRPHMMVLPNLDDLFMPSPEDLLVNVEECRTLLTSLLSSLPSMHSNTTNVEVAIGAVIISVYRIVGHVGGRALIFASGLPSFGPARLKNRQTVNSVPENDRTLLKPASDFYSGWAGKYSRVQLRADIFLFPSSFSDIATLTSFTQGTGGEVRVYPKYGRYCSDVMSCLDADLSRIMECEQSWEAVLRVRVTRGAKVASYMGNFFLRGSDLLAVPGCHRDDNFYIEVVHEETQALTIGQEIVIQTALLSTASFGERRIRIHNIVLKVIPDEQITSLFYQIDPIVLVGYFAKKAALLCTAEGQSLKAAREYIQKSCVSLLQSYRRSAQQQYAGRISLDQEQDYPPSLAYIPLYTLALLRCSAFRESTSVDLDTRSQALAFVLSANQNEIELYIRPRIYPVHDIGQLITPSELNLTLDELPSAGAYLLDHGITMYLWIRRYCPSYFLTQVLQINSFEQITTLKEKELPNVAECTPDSPAHQLFAFISSLRFDRRHCSPLSIIPDDPDSQGDSAPAIIEDALLYDRNDQIMSYTHFLDFLSKETM